MRMNLVEEMCRGSAGAKWAMLIDKMDQQKTILASMWQHNKTAFFAQGSRLVVGLIGSAWSGTRATDHLVRTVFEDCKHGAAVQASSILLNLHSAARLEGHLPEEFVINADNTVKETKNQTCLWFIIWLLCVLDGSRLWSALVLFLIVGHTHNRLDRFFGRLSTSLRGLDYFTLAQLRGIVDAALAGFDIRWEHFNSLWRWEELGATLPNFQRVRNVHAINVFRSGGVWIKWKMYMTDAAWSRPRLLVPPGEIRRIAAMRPGRMMQSFGDEASQMHSWVDRLETFLDGLPDDMLNLHRADLAWLHAVIDGRDGECRNGPELDEVIGDLRRLGGVAGEAASEPSTIVPYPEDILVEAFPGADHPSLPQDCLVTIKGIHEPALPPGLVLPGMFLCVRPTENARARGEQLPFLLGRHLPDGAAAANEGFLVEWYVPPLGKETTPKPGPKKLIMDIFGVWQGCGSCAPVDLGELVLPDCIVRPDDVLCTFTEFDDDGGIPFDIFDALRKNHGIDCTGLRLTSTLMGHRYRHYVLMMRSA